jgi:hypothetical protein
MSNKPQATQPKIRRSVLTEFTAKLQEYANIRERMEADEARKRQLENEIIATAESENLGTGQILAGVTLTVREKLEYSEAEATAWATDPTRLPLMPSVLTVSKAHTAQIVQLASTTHPELVATLELNKAEFDKALKNKTWVDAPHFEVLPSVGLTFSAKNFKARSTEIEMQFDVIEDVPDENELPLVDALNADDLPSIPF